MIGEILPQVSLAQMPCTKITFSKDVFYRRLSCVSSLWTPFWTLRRFWRASISCDFLALRDFLSLRVLLIFLGQDLNHTCQYYSPRYLSWARVKRRTSHETN